jgi:hypothetical protein
MATLLYYLGALGLSLSGGVFFESFLTENLHQNPANWPSTLILFGFAALCGLGLLSLKPSRFRNGDQAIMYVSHGLSLISIFWILLWCFVWLARMASFGDSAEMVIKHTAYLHLFGVGFTMAAYATGWMSSRLGERSARFLMAAAWAVSYVGWFNLYLQPGLKFLWAQALGGLLAVLGLFLLSRSAKAKVEDAS